MAKKKSKKKSTRSRKTKKSKELKVHSPLARQVFAFLLIMIASLIFIGGFSVGGKLPIALFDAAAWLVGLGAYFALPGMIIYWAVLKFKHEDKVIPKGKLATGLIGLVALAGVLHVFVDPSKAKIAARAGEYGGNVGYGVSAAMLSFLSNYIAFVLLLLIAVTAFMVAFGFSPIAVVSKAIEDLKAAKLERSERNFGDEDNQPEAATSLAELKGKRQSSFKLHEGIPGDPDDDAVEPLAAKPRRSTFKNSADKPQRIEVKDALTMATDTGWEFPSIDLLIKKQEKPDPGNVQENVDIIEDTLAQFKIDAKVEGVNVGPTVTQFALRPPAGVPLSKITKLESNIALDLAAQSIRIEAPIPGKRAVGIEVPNKKAAMVRLSGILRDKLWQNVDHGNLAFGIGRDIAGTAEVAFLEKMPHLLIAGQTGSGKSIMINTLLTSLLYNNSPSELKMILVDPKQVELTPYNDIPHLLTPVITEPEKCISALKWAVAEMERRLKTFAGVGKRSIIEYNALNEDTHMPYIVIVIDELADLMMVAARDVESLIVRIAQKARAAGIHLVLATQRPSVNVITGLIKANVPARIAFTVASQIDSRTILDVGGAEKLLGMGDMLFKTSAMPKPKRVQGAYISDDETKKVCDFLRAQQTAQYNDEVVAQTVELNGKGGIVVQPDGGSSASDDMWENAVRAVVEGGKGSTSYLQRRLGIGYGRASRMIDQMEEQGIVGPGKGSKPREVYATSVDQALGREAEQEPVAVDDGPNMGGPGETSIDIDFA